MDVMDMIAKRLAAKKNFRVVTAYASGVVKAHETETEGQAKNWAQGEAHKVGRDLIDRMTGEKVRVVSVTIEAI